MPPNEQETGKYPDGGSKLMADVVVLLGLDFIMFRKLGVMLLSFIVMGRLRVMVTRVVTVLPAHFDRPGGEEADDSKREHAGHVRRTVPAKTQRQSAARKGHRHQGEYPLGLVAE